MGFKKVVDGLLNFFCHWTYSNSCITEKRYFHFCISLTSPPVFIPVGFPQIHFHPEGFLCHPHPCAAVYDTAVVLTRFDQTSQSIHTVHCCHMHREVARRWWNAQHISSSDEVVAAAVDKLVDVDVVDDVVGIVVRRQVRQHQLVLLKVGHHRTINIKWHKQTVSWVKQ